jgi:16S rRNA G966 N2-methylase RsmD
VESSRKALAQLQATCDKLQAWSLVTLIQGDALQIAERMVSQGKRFDVIFLDPPFGIGILPEILPFCAELLQSSGVVYVESPVFLTEEFVAQSGIGSGQWRIIRQDKTGHVCYHLLQLFHTDNPHA